MPFLNIGGSRIEYGWYGPPATEATTLVFLHEGLGSLSMWKEFPQQLAESAGCGALVYSRAGYGNSGPAKLPRTVKFMHEEALQVLPKVLDALAIQEAVLVGHSDGGSIALINAGGTKDVRLQGLILEAPHVFVEELGLESIRYLAQMYREGNLRQRLEKYHGKNVDSAFWGWNDRWLDPEFQSWNIENFLPQIRVPVLIIQGEEDQYGTMAQVRAIAQGCRGPVKTVVLTDCGHSPHQDQPARTLQEMRCFIEQLERGRSDSTREVDTV